MWKDSMCCWQLRCHEWRLALVVRFFWKSEQLLAKFQRKQRLTLPLMFTVHSLKVQYISRAWKNALCFYVNQIEGVLGSYHHKQVFQLQSGGETVWQGTDLCATIPHAFARCPASWPRPPNANMRDPCTLRGVPSPLGDDNLSTPQFSCP